MRQSTRGYVDVYVDTCSGRVWVPAGCGWAVQLVPQGRGVPVEATDLVR